MLLEGPLYCDTMATVSLVTPATMQLQCFLMMVTCESYSLTNLQVYDTIHSYSHHACITSPGLSLYLEVWALAFPLSDSFLPVLCT